VSLRVSNSGAHEAYKLGSPSGVLKQAVANLNLRLPVSRHVMKDAKLIDICRVIRWRLIDTPARFNAIENGLQDSSLIRCLARHISLLPPLQCKEMNRAAFDWLSSAPF
jgi:hypothetical protein